MYVADQDAGQTITVSTVPPGGARSVLATLPVIGVPSGIALDQSLNAYVPVPCGRNVVYKVTPAGDVSVFATWYGRQCRRRRSGRRRASPTHGARQMARVTCT